MSQITTTKQSRQDINARYRAKHRDAINARNRLWYAEHLERAKEIQLRYRLNHPEAIKSAKLKHLYGITLDQFNDILAKQNGVCAICHKPETERKDLSVDHDHSCCAGHRSCGKCVRGLLCNNCNVGIGRLCEDPDSMLRAIRYLSKS